MTIDKLPHCVWAVAVVVVEEALKEVEAPLVVDGDLDLDGGVHDR